MEESNHGSHGNEHRKSHFMYESPYACFYIKEPNHGSHGNEHH